MSNSVKERIDYLREEVIKHDIAYAKGSPIITDTEYDKLYMELVELEQNHQQYYDENSPTQRIHDVEVEGLEKVKHTSPMLSQDKANTEEEIVKFVNKARGERVIVQQKLDGLTIVLSYDNGILVRAVTRGNGYEGEDVTHIIKNTQNVPKIINFTDKLEIRAEGIIPDSEFERVNNSLPIETKYKSSRNLASGTVRNLKGRVAKERGLKLITFDVVIAEGMNFYNDEEQLKFMEGLGFEVVEYRIFENKTDEDVDNLIEYVLSYDKDIRPSLPHKIDGLVLKFDSLELREELGYTSKFPRWGIAYKFESCAIRCI